MQPSKPWQSRVTPGPRSPRQDNFVPFGLFPTQQISTDENKLTPPKCLGLLQTSNKPVLPQLSCLISLPVIFLCSAGQTPKLNDVHNSHLNVAQALPDTRMLLQMSTLLIILMFQCTSECAIPIILASTQHGVYAPVKKITNSLECPIMVVASPQTNTYSGGALILFRKRSPPHA